MGEGRGNGWELSCRDVREGKAGVLPVKGLSSPHKGGSESGSQEADRKRAVGRVERGQGAVGGRGGVWPRKGRQGCGMGGVRGEKYGVGRGGAGGCGEGSQGAKALHEKTEKATGDAMGLGKRGDAEEASGNNMWRGEGGGKEGVGRGKIGETMLEKQRSHGDPRGW